MGASAGGTYALCGAEGASAFLDVEVLPPFFHAAGSGLDLLPLTGALCGETFAAGEKVGAPPAPAD